MLLTRGLLSLMPAGSAPLLIARDARRADPAASRSCLTVVTALVFGLLPAFRASRPDPWTTLKDTIGSIAGGRGSLFLRKGLVILQVALSFLLLFGAGLFVRSLHNLKSTDTGVALDNLVAFQLSASLSGYDNERGTRFYEALLEKIRTAPGREVGGLHQRPDPRRHRVGQFGGGRRAQPGADGEDIQAFMNAPLARVFRDDGDPDARGTRLHARGCEAGARRRDRQPAVRRALLQGPERDRQAASARAADPGRS